MKIKDLEKKARKGIEKGILSVEDAWAMLAKEYLAAGFSRHDGNSYFISNVLTPVIHNATGVKIPEKQSTINEQLKDQQRLNSEIAEAASAIEISLKQTIQSRENIIGAQNETIKMLESVLEDVKGILTKYGYKLGDGFGVNHYLVMLCEFRKTVLLMKDVEDV